MCVCVFVCVFVCVCVYIHIYIYVYIYINILNNSPYGKKKKQKKDPASDLNIKIYNESLSRGNIYIGKKEKANLVIPIEKNQKTHNWMAKRKKKPLRLLSYNAKSAQYQVAQSSNDNYLVSRELIYHSFALAAHQGT